MAKNMLQTLRYVFGSFLLCIYNILVGVFCFYVVHYKYKRFVCVNIICIVLYIVCIGIICSITYTMFYVGRSDIKVCVRERETQGREIIYTKHLH